MKTTKRNKVAIGLLTASVAMTPMVSFAMNVTEGSVKHEVPVLGIDGTNKISPEQSFNILVNKADKDFKSVLQQLEKQSFGVLITSTSGEVIFLDASQHKATYSNGKVSVKNPSLERYTSYQATILVKSEYQQALKGKFPSIGFNQVSFETGSAVGEATKVSARLDVSSIAVTEAGKLTLLVTDDYGNHAKNATAHISGEGVGNERVASAFVAPKEVTITNGIAEIPLTDKSAEQVTIAYTVVDNTIGSSKDVIGTEVITFTPGQMHDLVDIETPQKIVAGEKGTATATAVDVYGNAVADSAIELSLLQQNGGNSAFNVLTKTTKGEIKHNFEAPTKAGLYVLSYKDVSSAKVTENDLTVIASKPSSVQLDLPTDLKVGDTVPVAGKVVDEFGNPIINEPVIIDGAITGEFQTDENGNYTGSIKVEESGSIEAVVGGIPTPITNNQGTPITNVTIVSNVIPNYIKAPYELPNNENVMANMTVDSNGNIWVATVNKVGNNGEKPGIYVFKNGSWTYVGKPNGTDVSFNAHGLVADNNGGVYLQVYYKGVYYIKDGEISELSLIGRLPSSASISTLSTRNMLIDQKGTLFFSDEGARRTLPLVQSEAGLIVKDELYSRGVTTILNDGTLSNSTDMWNYYTGEFNLKWLPNYGAVAKATNVDSNGKYYSINGYGDLYTKTSKTQSWVKQPRPFPYANSYEVENMVFDSQNNPVVVAKKGTNSSMNGKAEGIWTYKNSVFQKIESEYSDLPVSKMHKGEDGLLYVLTKSNAIYTIKLP